MSNQECFYYPSDIFESLKYAVEGRMRHVENTTFVFDRIRPFTLVVQLRIRRSEIYF